MELYYNQNNTNALEQLMPEIGIYISKHAEEIAETQIDYLVELMIRSFISLDKYGEAMKWVNFWYSVPRMDVNMSIRRMFSMIIYYKMGLIDLLESEIISAKKELRKHKRIRRLEKTFLSFFRRIIKRPDKELELTKELIEKRHKVNK